LEFIIAEESKKAVEKAESNFDNIPSSSLGDLASLFKDIIVAKTAFLPPRV